MSDYYSITVRVCFGVLADSTEEAEQLASQLVDGMTDDTPSTARASVDAYRTLNQADYIKREAVNFDSQEPA